MADAQKRLPLWLLAGAVLAVLLTAAVGFIETVGRQETLAGRFEHLSVGMSYEEAVRVLGGDLDGIDNPPDFRTGSRPVWSMVERKSRPESKSSSDASPRGPSSS